MQELTPETIFRIHPKIRWAGLATDQGDVIFAKMRSGVESLTPEGADRSFMQMGPAILTSICERFTPWAGDVEAIAIRYEKFFMLVEKLKNKFLALTIEKSESSESIAEVATALRKLFA